MKKLLLFLLLLFLVSCNQNKTNKTKKYELEFRNKSPKEYKEYVFAIHPLHNPEKLFKVYAPLIDYLNSKTSGAIFKLEASRNYAEFEKKLYSRSFEFALPNPYQTLISIKHGYNVIAKMGDDHKFTGIIIVRNDSGIKDINDLKGKKVSYPSDTALAACIMPQYFFYEHGLDVNKDIENIYVGSQESSIMNVYLGDVSAGVTWPLPWETFQKEHTEIAKQLTVKWETKPLLNNGVVARDDVPLEVINNIAKLLNNMHTTSQGKIILSHIPLSRFELAENKKYKIVDDFLKTFSKNVRTLKD